MTSRTATVLKNEKGYIPVVADSHTHDIIWRGEAKSTKMAAFTAAESKMKDDLARFEQWLSEVDGLVGECRGVSLHDLDPDTPLPLRVWFEEGKPTIEAAAWAIEMTA